eukprot:4605796-Lingulodinium_polyedra.AAC.1
MVDPTWRLLAHLFRSFCKSSSSVAMSFCPSPLSATAPPPEDWALACPSNPLAACCAPDSLVSSPPPTWASP